VKSALNLSSIFRGIGARDPRQTFDLVEVLQPGITVGDYSKLGPLVIPPTSVFGGQVLGVHSPPQRVQCLLVGRRRSTERECARS